MGTTAKQRNVCCNLPELGSDRIPPEAFALLFGYFLDDGERLRTVILAAGGEDGVDEGDGRGVRGAKGSGFDAGEKDFVTFAGERGNVGVSDANAVGIAGFGQMHTFDGLAETAAEADGEDEIALVDGTDEVGDASRGCGCEDGQAEIGRAHV